MSTTRREFLRRSPALFALGSFAPQFLLRAAAGEGAADNDGRVLVVVQLSGGNDGLNSVVPFRNEVYRQNRPTLAVPAADVLKIDSELGFHPSLRGFADLLEAGRLAIVQGVGYDNPNRSHFESMDIWHTCRRKEEPRPDGWLGRFLEQSNGHATNDVPAMHLGGEKQPIALASHSIRVPTIRSVEQFQLQTSGGETREMVSELTAADRDSGDELLGFVQSSTTSALSVAERFARSAASATPTREYPATDLGQKLSTIARLIANGLSTRIYYVELDGFDTHAQQGAAHAGLLRQVGDAINTFITDMVSQGLGDRVLVTAFSEFGRRLAENASEGTDHGAGAPLFVAGTKVRTGLIGPHPSLTDLDQGDVKHHTDFRRVYAAVIEGWLGGESSPVLGGSFAPVELF
ncbi:MAG: DUF1501 domain-containing protein [Planctomycetaceae bacterium]|nr:DUF1501 domain-containing protein [Planctomycetaceae bacterium]